MSKLLKKFNRICVLQNILSAQVTKIRFFFRMTFGITIHITISKTGCKSEEYAGERKIYQRNNIMLTSGFPFLKIVLALTFFGEKDCHYKILKKRKKRAGNSFNSVAVLIKIHSSIKTRV